QFLSLSLSFYAYARKAYSYRIIHFKKAVLAKTTSHTSLLACIYSKNNNYKITISDSSLYVAV
ncbi:MAG: hypothetical protein ACRC8O_09625, partial [Plesiomonas shigelloides]